MTVCHLTLSSVTPIVSCRNAQFWVGTICILLSFEEHFGWQIWKERFAIFHSVLHWECDALLHDQNPVTKSNQKWISRTSVGVPAFPYSAIFSIPPESGDEWSKVDLELIDVLLFAALPPFPGEPPLHPTSRLFTVAVIISSSKCRQLCRYSWKNKDLAYT
jgi:hypothetical protein